jgi:uncharacterized lipoprotein YmbA
MKISIANFIRYSSFLALSVMALLISGCSSNSKTPLETNYYLLNSQHITNTSSNVDKTVLVEVLELPAYLHQPQLVMQLNKHQLHYARFDMWAEPLQSGFTKALIRDLNINDKSIQFVTDEFQLDDKEFNKLSIRVDYFHPSIASKVILSGVFWLNDDNSGQYKIQQPFTFELLLNEDGYTHAIEQMRQLVTMMSASVLEDNY